MADKLPIGEALRLLRTRKKLTQTAAGQLAGAPDFRTLSHWETRRKVPSFSLLTSYLAALGLNFHDLQDALDQVLGAPSPMSERVAALAAEVEQMAAVLVDVAERRLVVVERRMLKAGADGRLELDSIAGELATLAGRVGKLERLPDEGAVEHGPLAGAVMGLERRLKDGVGQG